VKHYPEALGLGQAAGREKQSTSRAVETRSRLCRSTGRGPEDHTSMRPRRADREMIRKAAEQGEVAVDIHTARPGHVTGGLRSTLATSFKTRFKKKVLGQRSEGFVPSSTRNLSLSPLPSGASRKVGRRFVGS